MLFDTEKFEHYNMQSFDIDLVPNSLSVGLGYGDKSNLRHPRRRKFFFVWFYGKKKRL